MSTEPTHIYLNPVAAERAVDFERFLFEVVKPAVDAQRPDLADRWTVLRPVAPEEHDAGVLTYAFLFRGGDVEADWNLGVLLPAHYGEEAERLARPWSESFVSFRRWVGALCPPDEDLEQPGWTFETVTEENYRRA